MFVCLDFHLEQRSVIVSVLVQLCLLPLFMGRFNNFFLPLNVFYLKIYCCNPRLAWTVSTLHLYCSFLLPSHLSCPGEERSTEATHSSVPYACHLVLYPLVPCPVLTTSLTVSRAQITTSQVYNQTPTKATVYSMLYNGPTVYIWCT